MAESNALEIIIGAKDQFSATFNKLKTALGALAIGYVVKKSFDEISESIHKIADSGEQLAKMSQTFGISVESLGKMKYAAHLADIDVETLGNSLKFMERNAAEAAHGNQAAVYSLERLGVSLGEIKNMAPDEMFRRYADAFKNIQSPAERASLAMDVFGRGGAQLIPLLREGSAGLDQMAKEAELFGVTTAQAAYNGQAFNDSLKRMEAAFNGVKSVLLRDFIPYLTGAFNRLAFYIAENKAVIVEWAKSFIVSCAAATEAVIKFGARAVDIYYAVGAAASKMAVDSKAGEIRGAFKELEEIAIRTKKVTDEIAQAETKGDNLNWVIYAEAKRKELVKLQDESETLKTKINSLNGEYQALVETWTVDSSKMFNEDAFNKWYTDLTSKLDQLKAEGMGVVPKDEKGPAFSSDKLTKEQQSAIDQLQAMWGEYYRSESENIDGWYQQQYNALQRLLGATAAWTDAKGKLAEIEAAKQQQAEDKRYYSTQNYIKSIDQSQEDSTKKLGDRKVTESSRVEKWYMDQIQIYGADAEAKDAIDAAYYQKKQQAEQADADYQVQLNSDRLEAYANLMGGLGALAASFGKKGFMLAKALNMGQAIISTYAGAANALKDYAYPYNIIVAASVIAFGMAQVAKIAAQKPPQAHAGLTYVPGEQTYLLQKGERVLAPEQNKDFTKFMESGGGVQIGSISFAFPNLNSVDDLKRMSSREWQDIIEQKMIPNMRKLAGAGIRA